MVLPFLGFSRNIKKNDFFIHNNFRSHLPIFGYTVIVFLSLLFFYIKYQKNVFIYVSKVIIYIFIHKFM